MKPPFFLAAILFVSALCIYYQFVIRSSLRRVFGVIARRRRLGDDAAIQKLHHLYWYYSGLLRHSTAFRFSQRRMGCTKRVTLLSVIQRMGLVLGLILCVVPSITHASMVISEVAWMGTADNANAEWIELYNDGAEQDVTGWTLAASDGTPQITFSGTISANGYALLERTSDDTVPGVTAFTIYTGALGNTGEVLDLRDAGGVLVDRVDGSSDWALGGDNDTKDTLQREGNPPVGSWTTGAPTPQGGATGSIDDEDDASTDSTDDTYTTTTKTSSGGGVIRGKVYEESVPRLDPALTLDVGEERMVTVGVATSFLARAYKESGKEIVVSNILWNFGDGSTTEGREVSHTFRYAGDYVVTVVGHRSGFTKDIQDATRLIVHVVEPTVEITEVTSGYIEIKNTGNEELDLSGFALIVESAHFRLPTGTVLLPKTSVRFPRTATNIVTTGQKASLYHPSGALASSYGVSNVTPTVPVQRVAGYTARSNVPSPASQTNVTQQVKPVSSPPSNILRPETALAAAFGAAETVPTGENSAWWWLLGLLALIFTAVVAVSLVRRGQTEVIEGFEIESDE